MDSPGVVVAELNDFQLLTLGYLMSFSVGACDLGSL